MVRWMIRTSWLIAVVMTAAFALAQTEFSADIVRADGNKNARIYFGKDKMRFESKDKDPRSGGSAIINLATNTTTVIMDQQHMYMELTPQMAAQRTAFNFFRTGDVENACSDWLQLPQNKGGSCHKVGNDTLNGRSCIKYEGTNSKGETGTVWVDPKLRFPLKWQGKDKDTWELQNIQEGSQPSSLFEIPAGYTKFDMGGMMQRPR